MKRTSPRPWGCEVLAGSRRNCGFFALNEDRSDWSGGGATDGRRGMGHVFQPAPMLEHLRGQASDRKLRLFAVACCHQVRDLFTSDRDGEDLAVVERFADGLATEEELGSVHLRLPDSPTNQAAILTAHAAAVGTVGACSTLRAEASGNLTHPKSEGDYYAAEAGEMRRQCRLLRDIFGNPFRPVTFDPDWLTSTVIALARQMYESRLLPDADPGRRAPGRGLRERRHPRPLPRARARTSAGAGSWTWCWGRGETPGGVRSRGDKSRSSSQGSH